MVKRRVWRPTSPRLLIVMIISVILNIVFIVGFLVTRAVDDSLLYAQVNDGVELMCSDEFRAKHEQSVREQQLSANETGKRMALIDYPCVNNGAGPYYEKGYNDYIRSLGLNP